MKRMTTAQALVEGLIAHGVEIIFGIFGHGNVQLGQAIAEAKGRLRYIPVKNEQAAVHSAVAYARLTGKPLAVTTSVGPGATNLVTGAACARINRLPVLLLPGEIFADGVGPVLQQVESHLAFTANDTLRPVSKYWNRLNRPEQLRRVLREAFDAMLEPGDEGPATICLPMDVQTESCEFDEAHFLSPRSREAARFTPESACLARAANLLAEAKRPFLIAGGGVIRSGAQGEVRALCDLLGMPVAQTQAGKGSVHHGFPLNVFAVGATGTRVGNQVAKDADVILGVGTRYADFTTASETAFHPKARFINVNLCHLDVGKEGGLKLYGDAKETLAALRNALGPLLGEEKVKARIANRKQGKAAQAFSGAREAWIAESDGWLNRAGSPMRQSTALGVINGFLKESSTIISAAGSLPGDLQKLWRDKSDDGKGYICEYGYSTMGFEIAAGLGARLACPEREVAVLCGDMSFLMASQELVTAVEQGIAFTVVVFDNHGGQSIRSLQRGRGFADFSMEFRMADGSPTPLDFVKLAEGMACHGLRANDEKTLHAALEKARANVDRPTVIQVEIHREDRIGDTGGWWDVPVPEVDKSGQETVARKAYLEAKAKQTIR